jgi:alpha-L-fucosidase 2
MYYDDATACRKFLLSLFVSLLAAGGVSAQQKPMRLWFDKPAYQPREFTYQAKEFANPFHFEEKGWYEALPVGNGRLGAMVFGGVVSERIQLNESSLWDGYKRDAANPLSAKALPEVQRLMFAGQNDAAEKLAGETMNGVPLRIEPYQSLGDMFIEQLDTPTDTLYTGYRRWLSLDSAVAVTQFRRGGVTYRREVFASHPSNVIVIRFSCDKPKGLNLRVRMMREKDAVMMASAGEPQSIVMQGRINRLNESTGQPAGMQFSANVRGRSATGSISVSKEGIMTIRNAGDLVLYITAATSYNHKNPEQTCRETIRKAVSQPVAALYKAHLADYQSLYNRVRIGLSEGSNPDELPQDRRLKRVAQSDFQDPYLSELLFQYGRYLLIASSRKGGLPANLQGIWNQKMNPPWSSDYHLNINLQMNYMAAETVNLPECTLPLFALIDSLALYGRHTAKVMYNARGWVAHHLTDVFWRTAPADGVVGLWPMGSGWLTRHLYDHYLYSEDTVFLRRRAFPVMKEAALFYLDFLVPVPAGLPMAGKLVTNPSHSPENAFQKADGKQYQFTYGATMDMQIIHELLTHCLEAIKILSKPGQPYEPEFKAELEKTLANLAPVQISPQTGILQEWMEDYKEPEIGHRHISHLYGLFPGNQITAQTPDLFKAARKSLERRLTGNPNAKTEEAGNRYKSYGSYLNGKSFGGWQGVWVSMMWLRLGEAEEAYKHHQYQLKYGMKPNFFGQALQLDGTYGSSYVVAEMLLQSGTGALNLLPALPAAWPSGFVSGLRGQGGFGVDIRWDKSQLTEARIQSVNGGECRLLVNQPVRILSNGREVPVTRRNTGEIVFPTQKGGVYTVNAAR